MKNLFIGIALIASITMTSCVGIQEVGRLNMVSCRNIETQVKYSLLKKNVEYTNKEVKKLRSTSIQQAVDEVVKKVDGGEYLMNAKIWLIVRTIPYSKPIYYYAVEGDVWGIPTK